MDKQAYKFMITFLKAVLIACLVLWHVALNLEVNSTHTFAEVWQKDHEARIHALEMQMMHHSDSLYNGSSKTAVLEDDMYMIKKKLHLLPKVHLLPTRSVDVTK